MIRFYNSLILMSLLVAFISVVWCLGLQGSEYFLIPILPATYLVAASLLLLVTWSTGPSLFVAILFPAMFLRYVAFPALVVVNGGYVGRSSLPPSEVSYILAILLMAYELLLVVLVVIFLERRYHRSRRNNFIEMRTVKSWYLVITILIAIGLIVFFPTSFSMIQLLMPIISDTTEELPAAATLAALSVMAVKVFVFLFLMIRLSRMRRWAVFTPWIGGFLCILNIGIYFGTNRMAIMLTAITSIWILRRTFGSRANFQIAFAIIITLFLFVLVTSGREYVSMSDSYLVNVADNIQAYTGGVYNVAIGIETANTYPEARSLSVLLFDFLRPTIGINLLIKNFDVLYSNIYFNQRMWVNVDRRSQIIPMIAQGNLFFGPLLSPLLSLLFVLLAYKLLQTSMYVKYIEIQYSLAIVILRLGFFWGQNSMNIMNFISLYLMIPIFLLFGFFLIRRAIKNNSGSGFIKNY